MYDRSYVEKLGLKEITKVRPLSCAEYPAGYGLWQVQRDNIHTSYVLNEDGKWHAFRYKNQFKAKAYKLAHKRGFAEPLDVFLKRIGKISPNVMKYLIGSS